MASGAQAGRPARGEQYNPGPATTPRAAATVIVLRGGEHTLEVLLVRRTPDARFMGGVWVFPGGAVDASDGDGDGALRAAAVRELREEAAIELQDADELVEFSRWITPAVVKTRYDTHFFLASLPAGQEPRVDGEECVDLGWYTPAGALEAHRAGEIALVFPTIKNLEPLVGFASAQELLAATRGRTIEPILPKVIADGGNARVVLPGEPGY
ncbi:MAG TPA: NUDIX hydrolase [Solirubrobacteraceae bacterium]|nr:NUDIX hydrolase [Solirubrobacteraceae bacterium]